MNNTLSRFSFSPVKIGVVLFIGIMLLSTLLGSFYVVEQGRYGVVVRFGEVVDVTTPGPHLKVPFFDDVDFMPSSLQTVPVTATAVSKDIQEVTTMVNTQYSIPLAAVRPTYSNYRTDVDQINKAVISPGTETVTKAVTAQYTAEELISKRQLVAEDLKSALKVHIARNGGFLLEKVDITNFGFSDSFTKAIEEKAVAYQAVLTARQTLEKKKVDVQVVNVDAEAKAKAMRTIADAEAYAMLKQRENLSPMLVNWRRAEAGVIASTNWRPLAIDGGTLMQLSPEDAEETK